MIAKAIWIIIALAAGAGIKFVEPNIALITLLAAVAGFALAKFFILGMSFRNVDQKMEEIYAKIPQFMSLPEDEKQKVRTYNQMIQELRENPSEFDAIWADYTAKIPDLNNMTDEQKTDLRKGIAKGIFPLSWLIALAFADAAVVAGCLSPRLLSAEETIPLLFYVLIGAFIGSLGCLKWFWR